MLDLDRLAEADRASRLFSINRWNVFSFKANSHGAEDGRPIKQWAVDLVAQEGITVDRVRLLAFPRLFGFVFNPLSMWFCDDADGRLVAIIYEVRNTFGEKHSYVLKVTSDGTSVHEWNKEFFVSPFINMDATYRFRVDNPDATLRVTVKESDSGGHLFSASMVGQQSQLTTSNLVKLFITHPLMSMKVIVAIHWQALHLWRKGAPYRSRPAAPPRSVSVPQVTK